MSESALSTTDYPLELMRLRVLIVDDDEDDYRYARSLLRQIEDFRFEVDWISRGEEVLPRLREMQYDICLFDYRLRRVTGLELLSRARKEGITVPIVLLTGQDDRTVDREALRNGASDYLIKGQLDPTLLERSIRYAIAQNRAEDALRTQYAFISAVLNTAEALVLVLDVHGNIIRFNRACETKSGLSIEEVLGKSIWEVFAQAPDIQTLRDHFDTGLSPERFPNQEEWSLIARDGQVRRIAWANAALLDKSRAVEFVVSVGIDVTEQRAAERALGEARTREIEVGSSIQRTLLVREPPQDLTGIAFGVFTMPSLSIDGDYMDVFVYDELRVDVLVGDVMGKGVPAALLGAATKTQFQRAVRQLSLVMNRYGRLPEPEEIVTTVHYRLTPELRSLDSFITLGYTRFDLERNLLKFVDCGSPPPIHYRAATKDVVFLQGDNLPLGMRNEEVYRQVEVPIGPGDLFVFYSDGVTEAADEVEDDLFGIERLKDVVACHSDLPPQALVEKIVQTVREFTRKQDDRFSDDLTCLAVRIAEKRPDIPLFLCGREFLCDPEEAVNVRLWLQEVFATYTPYFADEETLLMEVGLIEAFNNIHLHTYHGATDGRIQIEASAFTNGIQLAITDWGEKHFQPETIHRPRIEEMATSGYGLFLLHETFDWINYDRDSLGRNRLTLCKWQAARIHENTSSV